MSVSVIASQGAQVAQAVAAITDRLLPDNIPRRPSRMLQAGGIVAGISNPSDLIAVHGTSVAAGYLVDPGKWEIPGTGRPDGAYALFRSDDAVVEIVSDALASRTVWYAKTDDMFVASTSQRAIVSLLGTFELNAAVVPWMLASGTLGPGLSWDTADSSRRRRHDSHSGSATLGRSRSTPSQLNSCLDRSPTRNISSSCHRPCTHAVGAARVADPKWAITLSGGVDCRAILCLLKERHGLRAVTWGLRTSLSEPTNDAQIALRLARHFGLEHRYFETDLTDEPVERLFERFIANGEGRIDHISGYADGFRLWSQLVDSRNPRHRAGRSGLWSQARPHIAGCTRAGRADAVGRFQIPAPHRAIRTADVRRCRRHFNRAPGNRLRHGATACSSSSEYRSFTAP